MPIQTAYTGDSQPRICSHPAHDAEDVALVAPQGLGRLTVRRDTGAGDRVRALRGRLKNTALRNLGQFMVGHAIRCL